MTRAQKLTLIATILGSGVVFLDGSIVNLALVHIGRSMHVGLSGLQWVMDGYMLSLSALILLGGSLGDILGRKRVYLMGMIGFGVASLLCGLAPNATLLILMRIVQGIFGALMVPGSLAIINTNFGKDDRAAAIGKWTAWTSAIIAVAPLAGGYIVDSTSWRWIFFINPPILVVCYLLGVKAIKESQDSRVRRIDTFGAVLAMLSLAGITYGFIEGPARKWPALPVATLVVGAALFVVFLWFERRQKDPMLELSLFKSRNFTGANVSTFALYGALSGFLFALMIYLQSKVGYSSLQAGLSGMPVTVCLILLSSRIGRLSSKFGPRWFMTVGPILAGVGMLLLVPLDKHSSYLTGIFPGVLIFGLGMATTVAPLTTTVMTAVSSDQSGIVSAVNNAVSRVAGLLVVALLGLFGANHTYRFAAILCGVLAIVAGVISYMTIQNTLAKNRALKNPV